MKQRIAETEIRSIFKKALSQSLINLNDTAAIFYDISYITERINDLKKHFPESTLHAIAVKANPLIRILEHIKIHEVGLEVASLPELHIALKAGFNADKIVFDSPCKTIEEIEFVIEKNVNLNADSFAELERIDDLLKNKSNKANIGVRINPQVGTGTIKATSVADKISKFGIPIENNREKIIECYLKYEWLNAIHVHIGSQGCPPDLLINGIEKIYNLIIDINKKLIEAQANRQIKVFDIGGGLPVSYNFDKIPFSIKDYSKLIKEKLPELFTKKFKLVTEFGRYIHANTAWVASKIEYVKRENNYNIAITHLGADFFVRKCYNPNDWHHEITVLDSSGNIKAGEDTNRYIIAGPLCFAGDVIANDIVLPPLDEGDYIIIHDVGAYTLSMWSRYNSRQIPKVLVYNNLNTIDIVKEREKENDLYNFWK